MYADPVSTSKPILERIALKGRNALVTGGNKGIGRAIVHAYAQAGANVAILGRNEDDNEKVRSEVENLYPNVRVTAYKCDVTDEGQINNAVKKVVMEFGSLEIACNNAGIAEWVKAEEMTYQQWLKMISNNLDSAFLCASAQAKYMLKQQYGKIIFTSSVSAKIANYPQPQAHYNVAKAGVNSLTRCLATEWAERCVRVNTLSPCFTMTPLLEELMVTPIGQEYYSKWISRIPLKKMGEVTDMQGAAVFLASEASDFMTGADLAIDGGYLSW